MMKKFLVVLLTIGLLSSCGLKDKDLENEEMVNDNTNLDLSVEVLESEEDNEESEKNRDELISFDENWNVYKNYDFKYSIKVPKKSSIIDCDRNSELSDVIVLRDGHISYPITEYSYNGCEKVKNTKIPVEKGYSWRIYSKNVAGAPELESFVQERYGEGCRVDSIEDNGQIKIKTTGPDEGCFINFITKAIYNESLGIAVSYDIGQDYNFYSELMGPADGEMSSSFEFLK